MKKTITLYLLFLLLILNACRDDEQPLFECEVNNTPCNYQIDFSTIQDTCIEIIWGNGGIENIQTASDINFFIPISFSSTNEDRFIYKRTEQGEGASIWEYNLCKGESIFLNEDIVSSFNDMDISNDWMLYSVTSSQQLYKQKINGDSLTQLLPGMKCGRPLWLNEGEEILCYCRFESPTSFYNVKLTSSGEILDTMEIVTVNYDLMENKIAAISHASGEKEIGFLMLDSNMFQAVISSDQQFTYDMAWLDSEHIIWIDPLGIHKVNINTSEYTLIKEVCENVTYKTISVLPSQEELLLGYSHQWNIGLDTVHVEHEVVHFNLSTGEEQIVELE